MSASWAAFVEDPRPVCRYGVKCYQKNPEHRRTYKHPPVMKRNIQSKQPERKRFKASPGTNEPLNVNSQSPTTNNKNSIEEVSEPVSPRINDTIAEQSTSITNTITIPEQVSYHSADADPSLFKELFLVEMPQDFFHFQSFLQEEKDFEKTLASVNLQLIGPCDLFLGKLPILDDKELYLIHWRFFYDPPEFQAVLKRKGNSEFHIGYFRDDPNAKPVFLASNDSSKDCHITPVADNIFAAVYLYLEKEKTSSPFISISCQKLMEKVKRFADQHKYSLAPYDMKTRLRQSLTKTLHGAGIVAPYDKKTDVGYRKLAETDANLKKLFKKLSEASSQRDKDLVLSELQPVITFANIAVDECDFGTGLEAGLDLFCSGAKELEPSATSCLVSAYDLLNRNAFAKIVQAHLKYRRKGANMSVLNSGSK